MKSISKIGSLVCIIAISSFSVVKAQIPKIGIKGGLNYATITNVDDVNYKSGVLLGVFAELNLPALPVSVQPELVYVQYGANEGSSDANQTVNYIQVPVLFKLGLDLPASPVAPNVFLGPYFGVKTKAEFENNEGNTTDIIDDLINDTDFGVVIGGGLDISRFRVELRYAAGLKNIYHTDVESGEKNGALSLTVGIIF